MLSKCRGKMVRLVLRELQEHCSPLAFPEAALNEHIIVYSSIWLYKYQITFLLLCMIVCKA